MFPLDERDYDEMLSAMPAGFRPLSRPSTPPSATPTIDEDDDSSTLSPISPTPYDADDPDDAEWDPSKEKTEKRKNSFR